MGHNPGFPTGNAEALRSFVRGRECFQAYWGTRAFSDLEDAREHFGRAETSDPAFALASFYAAVADNELRRHDSAIHKLNLLTHRDLTFLPETYLHLAFAHTKKYTDDDWRLAEAALDRADETARSRGLVKLLPMVESYRVFLYSVIGGRSKRSDRERFLDEAIKRGQALLAGQAADAGENHEALLIEVHNALGIAYMRQGQFAKDAAARGPLWTLAEQAYRQALRWNPNVVRVLQNQGTLRMLQGDERSSTDSAAAAALYREALHLYERTLEINPHDQFPHFRMAVACAKLGDWPCALKYYRSGQKEPGAVGTGHWKNLKEAIDAQDSSRLSELS